jgi:hypothetical protein
MRRALLTLTHAWLVVCGCFRIQAVAATTFSISISFVWRKFWRSMLWGHVGFPGCNGDTARGLIVGPNLGSSSREALESEGGC